MLGSFFFLQGKVVGFIGDTIHVYNKNENVIHSSDYFENIKHRGNLLLMGDSLGDLRMAEGAEDLEFILKIGFLNFNVCLPECFKIYQLQYLTRIWTNWNLCFEFSRFSGPRSNVYLIYACCLQVNSGTKYIVSVHISWCVIWKLLHVNERLSSNLITLISLKISL